MKKRMIAVVVIVIFMIGGFFIYRHFIIGQVTDGPVMENPAGPMLELLNAQWVSEDGECSAYIDDYKLHLSYRQELVYSGNFTFDFPYDGNELNDKNVLSLKDKQFVSEDGSVSSTMESLYVENCRMYLDITTSKEGEDSIRRQVVLNRVEYGKPDESESEEIREVSEMAELVEFSWHQSAMSYNGCFDFQITSSEQEFATPRLYCDYTDTETGERIKLGEDDIGFQGYGLGGTKPAEGETWPTVPSERWEELADFLHTAELSSYQPPEPGLMDATDSKIQVTWQEDGEKFTNSYSGIYAHELLELLQDIAKEISTSE